jgi:ketosteroid isomerase-like protein
MKMKLPVLALFLIAGTCLSLAQQPNPNPDQQAIHKLDKAWSAAAGSKDLEKTVSYYSDDASAYPFNAPIATGKEAIQQLWSHLMSLPGFALSFTPTKIEVARSGDIAYDVGTFEMKTTDPQGKLVSEVGKYVVVWKKQPKGQWKVIADIFNTDK